MAWVLQSDRRCPGGQRDRPESGQADPLMQRGTLRVETAMPCSDAATVLAGGVSTDGRETVVLTMDAQGALVFAQDLRGQRRGLRLPGALLRAQEGARSGGMLRAVYAWDRPQARAWLRVECPDRGVLAQSDLVSPLPISRALATTILHGGPGAVVGPNVGALALADTVEPAGPCATLPLDAPVTTDRGDLALACIRPGQRVLTRDNGLQAVRAVVRRVAPTCGLDRAVRMRAPFGGLHSDLVVVAPHRVLYVGTEAEYLFGSEEVLIEAGHLGHGSVALSEPGLGPLCLAQLVFDRHEIIRVGGAWSESLLLPAQAGPPPPGHERPARPVLSPFEAATLIAARSPTASAYAA